MRKLFGRAAILVALAMTVAWTTGAQGDPRIGAWALNVAKSQYVPGPAPAKEVRTYAVVGNAMSVSVESVDQHGKRVTLHYTARDNSKDYPLTGLASADAIAMKRIDAWTFETETKKNGRVIGSSRGKISKDGKILVLISKTVSPAGQSITNLAVYDKQ